jgi:hypothetical protein
VIEQRRRHHRRAGTANEVWRYYARTAQDSPGRIEEESRQAGSIVADRNAAGVIYQAGQRRGQPAKVDLVKPIEQVNYLVDEILKVCHDRQSRSFYVEVAQTLPDGLIFLFLSEIKADARVRNRGAVFTSKVKAFRVRGEHHA